MPFASIFDVRQLIRPTVCNHLRFEPLLVLAVASVWVCVPTFVCRARAFLRLWAAIAAAVTTTCQCIFNYLCVCVYVRYICSSKTQNRHGNQRWL